MLYDPELRRSLINSLCFFASVPFGLIPPFIVAYLLHKDIPGNKLFRALIFAPTALSWVVIGMVGRQFFALRGLVPGGADRGGGPRRRRATRLRWQSAEPPEDGGDRGAGGPAPADEGTERTALQHASGVVVGDLGGSH